MRRIFSKLGVASFVVAFVVGCSSIVAHAAEAPLPKSGTVKVHSGWASTGETKKVGDNRLSWVGVFWGVSFNDEGKGFMHQMAWNCPAVNDISAGMMNAKGSCTLTDRDGDKLYGAWVGKGPVAGEFAGSVEMSGGTGKYTGIQGGWEFHCWGVGPDGQLYCQQQANYKLP